mmetsp:Transcript_20167/g.56739  ORF Transcript_20167/g.56739 Transcript_20167/m.56739 type:complete len:84 (-) Transcript_20167:2710-2961(-)
MSSECVIIVELIITRKPSFTTTLTPLKNWQKIYFPLFKKFRCKKKIIALLHYETFSNIKRTVKAITLNVFDSPIDWGKNLFPV